MTCSGVRAETWVPAYGYIGSYEVSDCGRVRNWKTLKTIQPHPDLKGYRKVILKGTNWKVATLVLLSFVGPRPKGYHAAHNDGVRTNDHLSNLRWATPSDNNRDKERHGTHQAGERQPHHKLTDEAVLTIRREYRPGVNQNSRGNVAELAARYGVTTTSVLYAVRRDTWRHLR